MLLRKAQKEDIFAIHEITKKSLGYDYPVNKMTTQFKQLLDMPTDRIIVAYENEEVIGYVHAAYYLTFYSQPLVNILGLAVRDDSQGKGVGRTLMASIEKWAKEIGALGIRLNSGEERKDAHQFYESMGYTKVKYQANFRKLF